MTAHAGKSSGGAGSGGSSTADALDEALVEATGGKKDVAEDLLVEGVGVAFGRSGPSDIEIRGGGAVAVDTETLRVVAARFTAAEDELAGVARRLSGLHHLLVDGDTGAREAVSAAWTLQVRLEQVREEATGIAEMLRRSAAEYELVELDAASQAAFLGGDGAAMERIDALRQALVDRYPGAQWAAAGLAFERAVMWPSELVRQLTELGFTVGTERSLLGGAFAGAALGGGALLLGAATGLSGSGLIRSGTQLRGGYVPVQLTRLPATQAVGAPTSLAAAAARIPSDGEARVRVEKYAMPDGTDRFAVYVTGTKDGGAEEAWDWGSNVDLALGRESASYSATARALEAAGAQPGDVVYAYGHSQGAMIASHLAVDGGYDTRALVTFGSPVEAEVGAGTLSVRVQHTEDGIAALAGGGHVAPVGSAGSFLVERAFEQAADGGDIAGTAHRLESYEQTAGQVDASTDPRVAGYRAVVAELDDATAVTTYEFGASRLAGDVEAPGLSSTRTSSAASG